MEKNYLTQEEKSAYIQYTHADLGGAKHHKKPES